MAPMSAGDIDAANQLIEALTFLTKALEIPTLAGYGHPAAEFHKAIPQMGERGHCQRQPGQHPP